MTSVNLIEEINERANAGKWCKRLYCTTCTARDLRAALAAHSSAEIIESLKALDDDFIAANFDLFLCAVVNASKHSSPENTLFMLGATPAAGYLRLAIAHHAAGIERSRKYDEQNSPEALRALRLAKKTRQLTASQPHRDLKSADKDVKLSVIEMLSSLPMASLLEVITINDFEIPKRAIGGMVFERVKEQIRKDEVSLRDKIAISALASAHGGHWKKLSQVPCP
jgi:hypothetical protein